MTLIPLLFISISDSLVILVFLCVPEIQDKRTKKQTKGMSGDSLCLILSRIHPSSSIFGPGTVGKHTHTHTHGCIRENVSPMLGNDDEQSLGQRLQQAWCVLASHYAAPIWARSCSARSSSRRWEGLSCLSHVRTEKHTSKRKHFFWYVPSCLGPTYIQLLFFYFLSMHSLFFLFIT